MRIKTHLDNTLYLSCRACHRSSLFNNVVNNSVVLYYSAMVECLSVQLTDWVSVRVSLHSQFPKSPHQLSPSHCLPPRPPSSLPHVLSGSWEVSWSLQQLSVPLLFRCRQTTAKLNLELSARAVFALICITRTLLAVTCLQAHCGQI